MIVYFFIFIVGLLIGIVSHRFSMFIYKSDDIKNIAEAIQSILLSFSVFFTTTVVWFFIARKTYLMSMYRRKYPAEKRNRPDTFRLVYDEEDYNEGKREYYLLDERTHTSHHIENMRTFNELNYYRKYLTVLNHAEFKSYDPGKSIDTNFDIIQYFSYLKS